jgi:broad specificity phosphatase PhoE
MRALRLLAVRHGQASFHADDYDQLSAAGREQARALGRWLLSHDERFDRVLIGALRRQAQTLAEIAAVYAEAGRPLPAAQVDPAYNEFDHRGVVQAFVQRAPEHPAVLAAEGGRSRDLRAVFELLRSALLAWTRDELDQATEAWGSFRQRTRGALAALQAEAMGENVLLVSSGGVIAQFAAAAMEAPDHRAVELNMSLRNSALCELLGTAHGLHLSSWNSLPHLADSRALWTHV